MEEKKAYASQLEEETRVRLERLRNKATSQPEKKTTSPPQQQQPPKSSNSSQLVEEVTKPAVSLPAAPTSNSPSDPQERAKWAYKRFVEITK